MNVSGSVDLRGVPVSLHQLSKRFGDVQALSPVDLEIDAGELVAFLGPSGCGKTTTLLLVAGIYHPSTGEVHFGGARVDHLHPRERDVGMVFQSYALYPHFSLFDNIAFPLTIQRVEKAKVRESVQRVADMLGIGSILDRRPEQVSGGQQQRAALARALVKEPRLLLLDEPLSNLDAQVRLQARGEIRRLQRRTGVTSILVTHDQDEALAMADRVAVFSAGNLVQFDTPHALYHHPLNTFVAGFVGHPPMNLLNGLLEDGVFKADPLRIETGIKGPSGKGELGIRPESIRLSDKGQLRGEVAITETMGRETLLTVDLEGGQQLKVLVGEAQAAPPGTPVGLDLSEVDLHYFDEQGERVET
jgi:inositol-phosphate transport system ATP-binding protein